MRTSGWVGSSFLLLVSILMFSMTADAADPGAPFPQESDSSDQKAGSILIYNIYTSSAASTNIENTRINITNTSDIESAFIHMFFVDGSACTVADSYLCLTPNQTASFLSSDVDPGITGYLVGIAVDGTTGCPKNFNYLIGDEYVKFSSGHRAALGADAFTAQYDQTAGCDVNSATATIYFDQAGTQNNYNFLPRALAIDNLGARADGNETMVIINRIGGNLATGPARLGFVFGLLYDDAENSYSFSLNPALCQARLFVSSLFPRTTPRIDSLIPTGRSGWMKFWADDAGAGILGAVLTYNINATSSSGAFTGGRLLTKLTSNNTGSGTAGAPSLVIPVFPPFC